MADGVTTRLQKDVSQLQKDIAKLESKFDGVTEQMKADIKKELERGMGSVQKELEKMFAGLISKVNIATVANSGSEITNTGSSGGQQKNVEGSSGVMIFWDGGLRSNSFLKLCRWPKMKKCKRP